MDVGCPKQPFRGIPIVMASPAEWTPQLPHLDRLSRSQENVQNRFLAVFAILFSNGLQKLFPSI